MAMLTASDPWQVPADSTSCEEKWCQVCLGTQSAVGLAPSICLQVNWRELSTASPPSTASLLSGLRGAVKWTCCYMLLVEL